MAEAKFRTYGGKTVSTTHSMNGSVLVYNLRESNKGLVLLTRLYPCAAGKYHPPNSAKNLRLQNAAFTC